MGDTTTTNPIWIETSGTALTGNYLVREIQWVDDNGDVAHDDVCTLTLNGVAVTIKYQMATDIAAGVIWRHGPFNPGIFVKNPTVTALTHGAVLIWLT